MLCDKLGIDAWDTIRLANCHPRVKILQPGCGVGGHCIAVDPWFLIQPYPDHTRLMRAARETNDYKMDYVFNRISTAAGRFKKPVIACFGVTYKPDVDDIRESPALHIVNKLATQKTGEILVVEPTFEGAIPELHGDARSVSMADALDRADICALLVKHSAFKALAGYDLSSRVVIDSVGLLR
jgi:UDP-N-acetyl-D-mannosaminuronic acid dehydrogenase